MRRNVFKDITINLTGPICSCREQALSWWPDKDEKGRPTLVLKCKTCATKLIVSNEKFIAGWSLGISWALICWAAIKGLRVRQTLGRERL